MISDTHQIRPRYGEVDKMGYVYHSNYVTYFHAGRTEMLRKLGICDREIEDKNLMMPVIDIHIEYKKPAFYDDLLTIYSKLEELPSIRCRFNFEIKNDKNELICSGYSTIIFVDEQTRKPMRVPAFVIERLKEFRA